MARLVSETIDPERATRDVASAGAGAVLTFAGTVRDHHRGKAVTGIDYHAYGAMATREMEAIEAEVRERWPGSNVEIVHRVGYLEVGETSVFIAVASAHRAEGFDALRYAIDTLKERVPIWKKEMYPDGYEWIEGS